MSPAAEIMEPGAGSRTPPAKSMAPGTSAKAPAAKQTENEEMSESKAKRWRAKVLAAMTTVPGTTAQPPGAVEEGKEYSDMLIDGTRF